MDPWSDCFGPARKGTPDANQTFEALLSPQQSWWVAAVFPQQIAPIGVRPLGRIGNAKRHIALRQISMQHLLSADAEGIAISEINLPHFKNRGIFNIC